MKYLISTLVLVLVCCGASLQVRADTLNITGTFTISNTQIDFDPAGTGVGSFQVLGAQTGIFAPLLGTSGTVKDLNFAVQPVGVPFLLNSFITFAANPNLRFDLTFINPGIFSPAQCGSPAAAGQTCTPAGSAFNLTNVTATSSRLNFAVAGTFVDAATNQLTSFTGTFFTGFSNLNYQQFLATLAAGGSVMGNFDATFEVQPIPEPATMLLLGTGLAGIAAKVRKRRKAV